jgi:hypothetical protein
MKIQSRIIESTEDASLLAEHGPLIHGAALWRTLGYVSAQAFRKAMRAGTVPVPTFRIETRRGRFAMTRDVAQWISTLSHRATATAVMADKEMEE